MYQYITIFLSTAERAKNWLQDHCNYVDVSIDGDLFVITYDGNFDTYNSFCDYMRFI